MKNLKGATHYHVTVVSDLHQVLVVRCVCGKEMSISRQDWKARRSCGCKKGKKQRNEEICSLRREGKNDREIGERFGISRQRVSQVLLRYNIHGRAPAKPLLSEAQGNRVLDMIAAGNVTREIAIKLGVKRSRLMLWMKRHGLKAPVIRKYLNKTYNRLTINSISGLRSTCSCSCGGSLEALTQNIVNGRTKSCGCLLREYHMRRAHRSLVAQR